MAARLGVGNEALAKILTCHNMDRGERKVVTEKKIRCQKALVYKEAVASRHGLAAHGKHFFYTFIAVMNLRVLKT